MISHILAISSPQFHIFIITEDFFQIFTLAKFPAISFIIDRDRAISTRGFVRVIFVMNTKENVS